MEHVVIRNADLNSTEIIRVPPTGVFTQARVGGSPFALDKEGSPKDLHIDDVLWVVQSGYGVVGKAKISSVDPVEHISRYEDIERLRKKYKGLAPTYWDDLRDRLAPAIEMGKSIQLIVVHYDRGENLPLADQFRLARERGYQSSWITLRDEERKRSLFKNKGTSISAALLEQELDGNYGKIPDRISSSVDTQIRPPVDT